MSAVHEEKSGAFQSVDRAMFRKLEEAIDFLVPLERATKIVEQDRATL